MAMEGPSLCDRWSAHHSQLMNPDLWSTLPRELLQCIFARLPLSQIIRLRCVSKEWMRTVTEADSGAEFRRSHAEANPKMFGLIYQTLDHDDKTFGLALCDVRSNEWYKFAIDTPYTEHSFITMCASDGGLVCIISRVKSNTPLLIIVCNPLTRQWKALPSLSPIQPLMVQLVMNRDTKGYQVVVVYCEGDVKAKVYNSVTGEWQTSSSTVFLGYQYHWAVDDAVLEFSRYCPCIYDSDGFKAVDGTLVEGASVKGHALVGGHLFVLHQDLGDNNRELGVSQKRYFISEYVRCKLDWVRLKDHSLTDLKYCSHSEHFDEFDLFGCKGFLLVCNCCESCNLAEVYDLSTGKWHVIRDMPVLIPAGLVVWDGGMCELQWDAVP